MRHFDAYLLSHLASLVKRKSKLFNHLPRENEWRVVAMGMSINCKKRWVIWSIYQQSKLYRKRQKNIGILWILRRLKKNKQLKLEFCKNFKITCSPSWRAMPNWTEIKDWIQWTDITLIFTYH